MTLKAHFIWLKSAGQKVPCDYTIADNAFRICWNRMLFQQIASLLQRASTMR
jgi:hypothetical protein